MKKILSLVLSVALVALCAVTASAASVAKFNVNLVSETDKEAVISIDFAGGTGFCAIDIEVQYDAARVKIEKAENGKGLDNFIAKEGTAFALLNKEINPVKGSMITITPFRVVDGKDLFVFTVKKLSKEALSNSDFKLTVTNCVDSSEKAITVSVTTDLQGEQKSDAPTTTTTTTSAPSKPTEGSSQSQNAAEDPTLTNAVEPDVGTLDVEGEASVEAEALPDGTTDNAENEKQKTIIIIGVLSGILVVAGIVTVIIIKKKNGQEAKDETKPEE